MADECVLCQIVNRELRAKVLYADDLVLAFDLPKDHPVRIAPDAGRKQRSPG